jgi:hypothetical protein
MDKVLGVFSCNHSNASDQSLFPSFSSEKEDFFFSEKGFHPSAARPAAV